MSQPTNNNLDDLIVSDDDHELIKLLTVKKHILNFMNKQEIVNFLVKLVKNSKLIEFERPNPENYISPSMPVLEIKIVENTVKSKFPKEFAKANSRKEILDFRSKVIYDELLIHFTNMMTDIYNYLVIGKEKFTSLYLDDISKIINLDVTTKEQINSIFMPEDSKEDFLFIFSMIYAVNFPYDNPNVDITKDLGCTVEVLI